MRDKANGGERGSRVRWLVVGLLMMLALLGHFNRVSISVAGSERFLRDGLMTPVQLGQVYTCFLVVYTLCMLPAGWWIDRLGPSRMLTCMAVGMGACVVLTGALGFLALPGGAFWVALMGVRGVAGMASTPLHPSAARLVALWIPPSARVWANGLVTAGALVGIAASYPVFGALMDWLDWPRAYVLCGLGMMAFGVAWHLLAADHATEHRWADDAERSLVGRSHLPRHQSTLETLRGFMRLFRDRQLVLLTLSYAAVGYFQYLFFYWIEYYFEKQLHLPAVASRRASAIVMLAMAAGMALGGWCADRLSRRWGRRWGRRALALGGMIGSAVFALVGLNAADASAVTFWFALALAALGACEGVFWTAVAELGGRSGGLAAAFLNTGGNGGGAVAPWLTALLIAKSNGDFTQAIGVACAVSVLGALLWLWLDPVDRDTAGEPGSGNEA